MLSEGRPLEVCDPLYTGGAPQEFEALCQEVRRLHPSRILKVGAGEGRGLLRLCEAAMPFLDEAVAIVEPEGGSPMARCEPAIRALVGHLRFRLVDAKVHLDDVHGDIGASVAGRYRGAFDFIFIDVDETPAGMRKIFELFFPCLTSRGVMAFHLIASDGAPSSSADGGGAFWKSLRSAPPAGTTTDEIIAENSRFGIGLLRRDAVA